MTNTYDNLNRLITVSNAYGQVRALAYELHDWVTNSTDANGVTVSSTYDLLGRLRTRTYPDSGHEDFGYSAGISGPTRYTNQIGKITSYAYDVRGLKTVETNANAEVIQYGYAPAGDLLSLTDGKSHTTQWGYDAEGRVTNKVDQAGSTVLKYTYDADGRLLTRWSVAKGTTYYTNDAVGNLTGIGYPSSHSQTYAYDALNRLTNMVDAAGTTKYWYTAMNQVQIESFPYEAVTNFYNNGLRIGLNLQQPGGAWTNGFVYDAAKRLTTVTSPAGTFTYRYPSGIQHLVSSIALPNSSTITNTYDSVARLTGTYLKNSSGSVLDSALYGYNQASQRTAFTNAAGTYVAYTYDAIGQLQTATSSVSTENRGYTYDAGWNLNYRTNNGTLNTFTVDNKNQLTADPLGTDGYDGNGNLTTRYDGGSVAYTYSYDDENRLTSVAYDDPAVGTGSWWRSDYVYDGLGRCRTRTDYTWQFGGWYSQGNQYYGYDGLRVIRDSGGTYTRGLDLSGTLEGAGGIGGLLARTYSGASYYYHADGNGNITYLEDTNQNLAASYRYDPFGNTTASSGAQAGANLYRFSSKEINVNGGIYNYGYRFYEPNLQRWPNQDPLGIAGSVSTLDHRLEPVTDRPSSQDFARAVQALRDPLRQFTQINVNLSLFVANDPVCYVDPRGLDWLDCMATCIQDRDPLNALGKGCLGFLGGTFPKSWLPVPRTPPPVTTVLSWLGLGQGTAASGANVARIVGRVFSPVFVGYGLYMAGVEAFCTGRCTGFPDYYLYPDLE